MTDAPILRRTFPALVTTAAAERDDAPGRILDLQVVPYDVSALVSDGAEPYLEQFARGAFARAIRAPDRVGLRYAHRDGLADQIGRGVAFADGDDGLTGSVRVLSGVFGDQALLLVEEGLLSGVSVGFQDMARRNRRAPDGAIIRERCHLVEVSLTTEPAYSSAVVVGRREAPTLATVRAELEDAALDPAVAARLRAVGITL